MRVNQPHCYSLPITIVTQYEHHMVYTAAIDDRLAQAKSRHVLVFMKRRIYLRQPVTFC